MTAAGETDLFDMKKYLLGVDGGGSKTAFMLTDTLCRPVAELKLSRSNPNDIGINNTISLLIEGFSALCKQADIAKDDIGAIFTGVAGVTANNFRSIIKEALSEAFPQALVGVNHDGVNILYAAFPDRNGVAVICGTGTSCFTKLDNTLHRIGGYGLFDLLGGGYEIGRAAISHALRSIDGRDSGGFLSEAVKKKACFDLIENLATLIASGKNNIATYALPVYDTYLQGDSYAAAILQTHTAYLAELINTAGRFFDGKYEVSVAGGIGKDPITLKLLRPLLNQNVLLSPLDCEPIYGAVARARVLLETGA